MTPFSENGNLMKEANFLIQKNKLSHLACFFSICNTFYSGCYLSLRFGAVAYTNQQVLSVLRAPLTDSSLQDVIFDLRLPRIFAAILVGAAMAQAGSIIQGVTRNPIADPGLLGINAGAGLSLIAGYAIFGSMHYSMTLFLCLIGASLSACLIFGISYHPQKGLSANPTYFSGSYDFDPLFIFRSSFQLIF